MPRERKVVNIEDDVLRAVSIYARDSGTSLDDIHNEALRELLKRKGQPVGLHEALKQSAKMIAANDGSKSRRRRAK
ncbi:hypothetical protein [Hyphomicrobium sp. DY-1]|uniref:hypothetical protein n=1 Tax=Hyphomicrobium sp. DY-1 TaxID=3075650 RepID=UPI0039C27FC7